MKARTLAAILMQNPELEVFVNDSPILSVSVKRVIQGTDCDPVSVPAIVIAPQQIEIALAA